MKLRINDWIFDIDIEATRDHSSFAALIVSEERLIVECVKKGKARFANSGKPGHSLSNYMISIAE